MRAIFMCLVRRDSQHKPHRSEMIFVLEFGRRPAFSFFCFVNGSAKLPIGLTEGLRHSVYLPYRHVYAYYVRARGSGYTGGYRYMYR